MRRYRAVVGVLLAAIATFLVSCGGGPAAVAPTYTPEKITQLQSYVNRIETSRERLPELKNYIEKDNWVNVDNFTHGPLGELRSEMLRLANQLLPDDQPKAKLVAEDILGHLQKIDEASQGRRYDDAIAQYRELTDDFDAFLSLVPEGARKRAEEFEEPSVYQMTTPIDDPIEQRAEPEDMVRTPTLLDGGSDEFQEEAEELTPNDMGEAS
ncbi:MAG: photosystem II protein PsbQ [Phormidesmis sp.]